MNSPWRLSSLERLRLKDVRAGAGDEVQAGMIEHLTKLGLIRLDEGVGHVLTEAGEAALNPLVRPTE